MATSLTELKTFLKKAATALPSETDADKANIVEANQSIKALEAAEALLANKDEKHKEEKEARAIHIATKWSNELVFTLYRKNLMTSELEAGYRKLNSVEEATESAKKFFDEREEKRKACIDAMQEISEIDQDIDVFLGVLGGKSKKEAKELVKKATESGASTAGITQG